MNEIMEVSCNITVLSGENADYGNSG